MKRMNSLVLIVFLMLSSVLGGCQKSENPNEPGGIDSQTVLQESAREESSQDKTEELERPLSKELMEELTHGVLDGHEVELYWEDIPALRHSLYENWNLYADEETPTEAQKEAVAELEASKRNGDVPQYLEVGIDGESYIGKYAGSSIGRRTERLTHTYQMGETSFEVFADNLALCGFFQGNIVSDDDPLDMNEAARIIKELASEWIDCESWDARFSELRGTGAFSYSFSYAVNQVQVGCLEIQISKEGRLLGIMDWNSRLMDEIINTEEGEAFLAEKISLLSSEEAFGLIQEKLIKIASETDLLKSLMQSVPTSVHPYDLGNTTYWKVAVFGDGSFALQGCVETNDGLLLGFLLKEAEPTKELPVIDPAVQGYEVSEADYQYAWETSPYYVEGLADCPYEIIDNWSSVPEFWETRNNPYYSLTKYPKAENPVIVFDGREYTGSFVQSMYEKTICARRDVYHFSNALGEGEFELNARTGDLICYNLMNYSPDPQKKITEEDAIALAREFFDLGDKDDLYTYTCSEMGRGKEIKGYMVDAKIFLNDIPIAVPLHCYIAADGMIYYFYRPVIEEEIWEMMLTDDALERLSNMADYFETHQEELLRQADPGYTSYNRIGLDGGYMLPDGRWVYQQLYDVLAPDHAGGIMVGLVEPE
ncbi:MAG: hypothetical protein J6P72_10695 [Firmicutes bacterium]|nr:hypothetical protein [Bacillota bacterium]